MSDTAAVSGRSAGRRFRSVDVSSPAMARLAVPEIDRAELARSFVIGSTWARVAKRTIDLIVGIPLFIALVLVLPFVALAQKLTSPGPILFRQVRIGRFGQPIVVYKFRSMDANAELRLREDPELYAAYLANGFKLPAQADPRIGRVGRFLRRTSIDEFPQVVCLLRGTMSAVGPRPVVPDELSRLHGGAPDCYLVCKPGLTGLWQVSGRSHVQHDDRARLDQFYASEWSLAKDISILVRTVPAVLTAHGAH